MDGATKSKLDELQAAYRTAVDEWVKAIRAEAALASVDHSVAKLDEWEQAHFREDDMRKNVLAAKRAYEDALRSEIYGF
ncbi:MAG TPA: hypothetical protein VMI72_16300 [Roseiarcus sp.]|nr:hypothetical protein [Roseiarcus sp.]